MCDYVKFVIVLKGGNILFIFCVEVEVDLFCNVLYNLGKYKGKFKCLVVLVIGSKSNVCKLEMYLRFLKYNVIEYSVFDGGYMFLLEYFE